MKNQLPMSVLQQNRIHKQVTDYLHKEVFATPRIIASALEVPVHRVQEVLLSSDFYSDDKGRYALQGKTRQLMNQEKEAAWT